MPLDRTQQDEHETDCKRARIFNNTTITTAENTTQTLKSNQLNKTKKMVPDELTATEYLNQLLQDKTTVSKMPKIFLHSERLLDEGEFYCCDFSIFFLILSLNF